MMAISQVYEGNDAALELVSALHKSVFEEQGEEGWTKDEFKSLLTNPVYECYLYHIDDEPFGLSLISNICGEMEIITVGIIPTKRHQGLGRSIIDALLTHATASDISNIHIEVRADNVAALQLYITSGFTDIGRRADYYTLQDKSKIDAILMTYDCAIQ